MSWARFGFLWEVDGMAINISIYSTYIGEAEEEGNVVLGENIDSPYSTIFFVCSHF